MSTKQQVEKKPNVDTQQIDDYAKLFKLDRRMIRKLEHENKKFAPVQDKKKQESPPLTSPNIPALYPGAKEFNHNIDEIKQLPVEERAPKYQAELSTLQELGQKLIADKRTNEEDKKPIAADIKTAREKINSEMSSDVDEIKNLKIVRKKSVTDQLDPIKVKMGQVEKIGSDNGEVTQAIMVYQTEKTKLLKALTLDMTEPNFKTADATVKRLVSATDKVIAINKDKGDRIAASQQTLNTLGPNLKPDEQGSFPQGSTKTVSKATDRTIGGHGPIFKHVVKALADVEKSPVEPGLTTLENAAKAYLADYDRRVKEGQDSGKAFKPDKITTAKADACHDAIEKVRKLRVTRDIQDDLTKLPKNPRTPDEEKAVNRLKAKMIAENGGSKKLGDDLSGASESFFLTDPTTNEKAFIFKPSDGEFDAGYGWKKGGGAPREVVLGAVNETLKNSLGLDCGVSQTTLVTVDSPTVATDRNGNNSKRTGAIQNYVKSDTGLTNKLDRGKSDFDANFINQIPPEEIEKVALLDFVTLQMDRQASNLLVQPDSNGAPRLTPIDAGNAMPSRKAFEASRRMFTNNAVLGGAEAKKKFSPEALAKIDDLDPDAITGAMRKANADMAKVDPNSATAVEDETIEMTRRSILFLKQAAKVLTKAEIADAYANLFQNVIDAKPNAVDTAIQTAIAAQLAKPAKTQAVDQFPNAKMAFTGLGWPNDEFGSLRAENPERLLGILTNQTECPATLAEIQRIIQKVGIRNFDPDPTTITPLNARAQEVRNQATKLENTALANDPELPKKAKKLGAEFVVVNKKGESRPMTDKEKAVVAKQVNKYSADGGDDVLKRRGKSPSKMTFEEKYYELLGGDEFLAELAQKGLNPYLTGKIPDKIDEIELYNEFIALGGEEAYVNCGCPQNKEVTLYNRVTIMKQKLAVG